MCGSTGGLGFSSFSEVFRIWEGGIVLYGSGIGAAVGFLLYRLLRPFPVRPIMDTIAPAVALGIAIGRVGCFLNGCCFGDRCEMPWGVRFPGPRPGQPGSPPWADQVRSRAIEETASWSLPVHPTQLYSAVDGLILMVLLLAYYPLAEAGWGGDGAFAGDLSGVAVFDRVAAE